jgi:hypothetical protein
MTTNSTITPELLDQLLANYEKPEDLTGEDGLLKQLTKAFIPRQWKVIQHVREKFSCRTCEAITQPPAPSHPIARGRAGPGLLGHILFAKRGSAPHRLRSASPQ